MSTGVNENGVRWILQDGEYQCYYYFGEGLECYATFKNVTFEYIQNVTFYEVLFQHLHCKKNTDK